MKNRDHSVTGKCLIPFCGHAAISLLCCTSAAAIAGVGVDTTELNEAVTTENIRDHLEAFQDIANRNGGTREASGNGYFESVLYVSRAMTLAGYHVDVQLFPFPFYENLTPPVFEQLSPASIVYELGAEQGFNDASYSGSGDVTGTVEAVDVIIPAAAEANTSNSGCESDDFAGFTAGNIALVQRGACSFAAKAINAELAGAVAVIIFNEGQEGRIDALNATLGGPGVSIPVIGTSYDTGVSLASEQTSVRIKVDSVAEERVSANVIADTPIGNSEQTVVVGAHLDSVSEGPGINDNGSGSAAILEVALQMSELGYLDSVDNGVRNRVRFAWWGAEEAGLLGSDHYVNSLSESELAQIVANLNFDMVASPNYVRFVYDGDGSASENAGPEGSAFIEWLINDYFMEQGLAATPTAFDGRSDYGPFIQYGIPAGGLFTGAEGIKTAEEAGIYGGIAGEAYDPCYHAACDTMDNINYLGLDEMSDAMAYAINVLAVNDLPAPSAKLTRQQRSQGHSAVTLEHRGTRLTR